MLLVPDLDGPGAVFHLRGGALGGGAKTHATSDRETWVAGQVSDVFAIEVQKQQIAHGPDSSSV